jgi:multidrug efflux pump subunit AcrA (membrane-fusion protein)
MIRNSNNYFFTAPDRFFVKRVISVCVSEAIARNWVWILMLAFFAGGGGLLFLAATDAQEAREPKGERVANPPSVSSPGWLTFDHGIVVAPESYEIAAKESGNIAELSISENDLVKVGQSIGQLDSESAELERQVTGLQAQMATSEASDESGVRLAENKAKDASLQLESYEEMLNKGGASSYDVRQKKLAVEHENWLLKQRQVEFAKRQLVAKQSALAYQLASHKVNRLKLTSPATGTVSQIDRRAGASVVAGTTIAKVTRLDELRVDFFVDMALIDPSSLLLQPVNVITAERGASGNQTFAGKITGFASEVGSTGKVLVNATVQNQQINDRWVLLPGMKVKLMLVPKSK